MIHDQDLVDRLSQFPTERFEGEVFRATGVSVDPAAASINGGRWAPPPDGDPGIAVLYTSFERDGAIAELAAFLAGLNPVPRMRPIKVTLLGVSTVRTVQLSRDILLQLGVDMARYGERDYNRTQRIGAAFAFLGIDGLITPSARWACDNLTVFAENHPLTERLDVLRHEEVDWVAWARVHGIQQGSSF
jgi:hypothetical protein